MKLIDADVLKERLLNTPENINKNEILQFIEQSEEIEAKLIHHAQWQLIYHDKDDNILFRCSNCGENATVQYGICPRCKADMDQIY